MLNKTHLFCFITANAMLSTACAASYEDGVDQGVDGPELSAADVTTTDGTETTLAPGDDVVTTPPARMTSDDLVYLGAFALPKGRKWARAGHAMAHRPSTTAGNYKGSLFMAGNTHADDVAELAIPEPTRNRNFRKLPRAQLLSSQQDVTGGLREECSATGCAQPSKTCSSAARWCFVARRPR